MRNKIKFCFIKQICQFVRLDCRASLAMMVVFFAAIVFSLSACGEKDNAVVDDGVKQTIKIGVSLPLTGEGANVGEAARKAIELAAEKWNVADAKYNYEFIFENDMLQSKQGAIIAQKFVGVDKVNAIISLWGIVAPVISEVAQRNKIINMTCAGLDNIADPYYVFNNYTQYDAIGKELAKKLKKDNIKSIVYIAENNSVGDGQSKVVSETIEKEGIKVLKIEKFLPDNKDYRMAISKLEKLNPDYYVMFLMMPGTTIFVEQFKQVTGKNNLAAIDVFQEMPEEFWPVANGLWYVKSTNGTAEFLNDFKQKTNITPQSCTGNQYDNVDLLIWAYENTPVRDGAKVPDNEDVVKTLHGVKNSFGAIGEFSIDDKGIIHSKATLMKMEDGKPVELGIN
ncbi:MAG: ABC transporter substrate-binding protein [Alphaproteobacteria bacterium]